MTWRDSLSSSPRPQNVVQPERRLWVSVLLQAIEDLNASD